MRPHTRADAGRPRERKRDSAVILGYPLSLYGSSSSYGYSQPVIHPGTSIRIRCFGAPLPRLSGLVNAKGFLERNFPKEAVELEAAHPAT